MPQEGLCAQCEQDETSQLEDEPPNEAEADVPADAI